LAHDYGSTFMGSRPYPSQEYGGVDCMNSEQLLVKYTEFSWRQRNNKYFWQIYFIFARFCNGLLKEGSKDADVNEGKFILNIDALFAL
jgi:hypothetical protein